MVADRVRRSQSNRVYRLIQLATFALGMFPATGSTGLADEALIESQIESLLQTESPGVGYSSWFAGSSFLPYPDSEELDVLIIGATQRSSSPALKTIVEQGAAAVPILLKHLEDRRTVNIPPLVADGMVWMKFPDEYDFNSVTRSKLPEGVNRAWMVSEPREHPNSHTVTIGDLCFVALGQIVNRNYQATRYQPTFGIIVNSPTYSHRLRSALLTDWSDWTAEKHRQLLMDDFRHPDTYGRRRGAYLRLSFYYPDAVESLVLEELSKPMFNSEAVFDFCRNVLYKADTPDKRQQLYSDFIQERGAPYPLGVEQRLFADLGHLEATEERRSFPPQTEYSTQPRELLIQLFEKPANVRSTDCPPLHVATLWERSDLIRGLVHDDSKLIGDRVQSLFLASPEDEDLASACLTCLASRGYGSFLVEQLNQIHVAVYDVSPLHLSYIRAAAKSDDPLVKSKFRQIAQSTLNPRCFMLALPALDTDEDQFILQRVREILAKLPAESGDCHQMLEMVRDRFPEDAKAVFVRFLEPKTTDRIMTVCDVLWGNHPLAVEVLTPFLVDRRELTGFIQRTRVCDRVREAMGNGK